MKTKVMKLDPRAVYHGQPLNKDGSEKVDRTVISKPLRGGQMSAEQKLKQMVQQEMARAKEADESHLDYFDFEVPDDPAPIHSWVIVKPMSKKELVNEIKSRKSKASLSRQKSSGSVPEDDESSQRAQSDKDGKDRQKVANDKGKSARDNATEGADDAIEQSEE